MELKHRIQSDWLTVKICLKMEALQNISKGMKFLLTQTIFGFGILMSVLQLAATFITFVLAIIRRLKMKDPIQLLRCASL